MQQLAMTFATLVYESPGNFNNNISGGVSCGAGIRCGKAMPVRISGNHLLVGPYALFTAWNPYIYSIISDFYASNALYAPAANSNNDPNIEGYAQLALAVNTTDFLHLSYKNPFNPIALFPAAVPPANMPVGGWEYAAATGGDFDGSGNSQLVAGTYHNELFFSSIDPVTKRQSPPIKALTDVHEPIMHLLSGKFAGAGPDALVVIGAKDDVDILGQHGTTISSLVKSPFLTGLSISGAASGDFDPAHPGDEVLLIDNHGGLHLLYFNPGNSAAPFTLNSLQVSVTSKRIAKVTAGHFYDNSATGGGAEFAIADDAGFLSFFSLHAYPWSVSSAIAPYAPPSGAAVTWDGIACGDFFGTGYDQVVAHSGYDGQFLIYGSDTAGAKIKLMGAQAFPDGEHMPDGATFNTGHGYSNLNNFKETQKWHNGRMATFKSCPGAANAALATLRNCDGKVSIFSMAGSCVGLAPGSACPGNVLSPSLVSPKNDAWVLHPSLLVKPNPSNGLVSISTPDGKSGFLNIYTMQGGLIYSNPDGTLSNWMPDLSSVPAGIYFAKLITSDGMVETQKIIHQ